MHVIFVSLTDMWMDGTARADGGWCGILGSGCFAFVFFGWVVREIDFGVWDWRLDRG